MIYYIGDSRTTEELLYEFMHDNMYEISMINSFSYYDEEYVNESFNDIKNKAIDIIKKAFKKLKDIIDRCIEIVRINFAKIKGKIAKSRISKSEKDTKTSSTDNTGSPSNIKTFVKTKSATINNSSSSTSKSEEKSDNKETQTSEDSSSENKKYYQIKKEPLKLEDKSQFVYWVYHIGDMCSRINSIMGGSISAEDIERLREKSRDMFSINGQYNKRYIYKETKHNADYSWIKNFINEENGRYSKAIDSLKSMRKRVDTDIDDYIQDLKEYNDDIEEERYNRLVNKRIEKVKIAGLLLTEAINSIIKMYNENINNAVNYYNKYFN